jgi:hypothetical protein
MMGISPSERTAVMRESNGAVATVVESGTGALFARLELSRS